MASIAGKPAERFAAGAVAAGSPLLVVGSRPEPGRRSWKVLALVRGGPGELLQAAMTPAEARKAARDLERMADICDQGWRG